MSGLTDLSVPTGWFGAAAQTIVVEVVRHPGQIQLGPQLCGDGPVEQDGGPCTYTMEPSHTHTHAHTHTHTIHTHTHTPHTIHTHTHTHTHLHYCIISSAQLHSIIIIINNSYKVLFTNFAIL